MGSAINSPWKFTYFWMSKDYLTIVIQLAVVNSRLFSAIWNLMKFSKFLWGWKLLIKNTYGNRRKWVQHSMHSHGEFLLCNQMAVDLVYVDRRVNDISVSPRSSGNWGRARWCSQMMTPDNVYRRICNLIIFQHCFRLFFIDQNFLFQFSTKLNHWNEFLMQFQLKKTTTRCFFLKNWRNRKITILKSKY